MSGTVLDLIRTCAADRPHAVAIQAPGRRSWTYEELIESIARICDRLATLGVRRGDRVALVSPDGPEMAAAVLAISSVATCAPLNPAYTHAEVEFYLADLKARALVVAAGIDSPARSVAAAHGIPVLEIVRDAHGRDGTIDIHGPALPTMPAHLPEPRGDGAASSRDALALHTSGTTSRPKLVLLTHANLAASALGFRSALALGPSDRCLNTMPLFHIHGLAAGLFTPLASGGTVVCPSGFDAATFFDLLDRLRPTWYTAAPTIHQAILARARRDGRTPGDYGLRLIRSSSSPLPQSVLAELERLFSAPVIECYGMTEASTLIAANPLPPAIRKPSSVGLSIGPDIALLTPQGLSTAPEVDGEVVLRGPSVIKGYATESANSTAFVDGWLRTGDIGRFDRDGYLFLVGRSKEIINRGAEKIAPREVDEALLEHPGVAQAVAFAMPDTRLGEDVAAVVVLKPDAAPTEQALREFVSSRLAFFKVPRRILMVDKIPVGPTGKPDRGRMAERFDLRAQSAVEKPQAGWVAPRTALEASLASIAAELLAAEQIGIDDDLFLLGFDSILATRMVVRIEQVLGIEVPLIAIFDSATIADLGARLEAIAAEAPPTP
jgi:acyl-CoA synthetase (AMP-forming)/AMP-acid ligase II/acyl carrier protein